MKKQEIPAISLSTLTVSCFKLTLGCWHQVSDRENRNTHYDKSDDEFTLFS